MMSMDKRRAARHARNARWHRMHCEEGMSMRLIADLEGTQPSTVMRGIRRHEDTLDQPPPPEPTLEETLLLEVKEMIHVQRFYNRGYLTPDHVAAALRFKRNHKDLKRKLPATMWRILNYIIVENGSIEHLEDSEKLPQRGGKGVVRVLLEVYMQMENHGVTPLTDDEAPQTPIDQLQEQIDYLTGDEPDVYLPFMTELGMTQIQARMLTILLNEHNKIVTKETLHRRLYGMRAADEMPDIKIIDVHVCKIRKMLEGTPYEIITVWGMGYKLVKVAQTDDTCHDTKMEGVA